MKKQIPTIIGILIVLLFTGVIGISVFFLSQEDEKILLLEEDSDYEKEITSIDEKSKKYTENFEDLLEVFDDNCRKELFQKKSLYDDVYDGFAWVENDKVHLVQGYMFAFESDVKLKSGAELTKASKEGKEIKYVDNPGFDYYAFRLPDDIAKERSEEEMGYVFLDGCGSKILSYLYKNFSIERKDIWKMIFKRDDVICIYEKYSPLYDKAALFCGDIEKSVTPKEYAEIFKKLFPDAFASTDFRLIKSKDNFALIGTLHYRQLLKKEGEEWRVLAGSQDSWSCEMVFSENPPPSFVENTCIYKEPFSIWKYDEEKEEWGIYKRWNEDTREWEIKQ